mmetsp:Transcript_18567/g.39856  ORF Transcript_18567/g.39856 Transcript_18567/m.39856 type:complete len:132 (+) Transcript_18567:106-501(+)|eukprot:CAMPEP_0202889844 /NCGR_PEP_ID=MMETSP1392-20130828/401_1 /ASSEMBLY_ACC=CAM_ASM_000868 /TAXON_ID=225041 /ORGANISM="Chlamydomonas chlamydogama, Strain SAG 11-48b" /LENGTH=131 /DNA_ID=CAMNT_0049573269 /DNA_START=100 /DNA_END=495 /DNA_ORIENTATION=-
MSFVFEYLQGAFGRAQAGYDQKDVENWSNFLQQADRDRQRDRLVLWRDRTTTDDFAASGDSEYYRRTAGFVWRYKDVTGKHQARNHQYLYNLEVYGHRQYTRRDKADLQAAEQSVQARVVSGELGPLSPLE